MLIPRVLRALLVVAVVIGVPYSCASTICQHRASYPGGLTFIGQHHYIFGSEYERVAWHVSPLAPDELPNALTIGLDDRTFDIAELTPALVTEFGGALPRGGWRDANGNGLGYLFEDDRLIHFSFDSPYGRYLHTKPKNFKFESITISINQGPAFNLPMSYRGLVRHCGKPLNKYLQFSQ